MLVAVIEDEPDLRNLLVEEIEDLGHEVVEASDGQTGLELVRTAKPDVICSDINMPGMSGHELKDALDREGLITSKTVFIFISSNATRVDIADGLMSGASHYFTKPIDYVRLGSVLEQTAHSLQEA